MCCVKTIKKQIKYIYRKRCSKEIINENLRIHNAEIFSMIKMFPKNVSFHFNDSK